MALSTLADIRTKVRRLTRSPAEAQLSTTDLDNYINTFVLYDFPEHLRTFNLRQKFTFFCNPYQDTYNTDTASFGGATTNPLYNFQNKYLTVHPPVYVAGYQIFYSQDETVFFGTFPKVNSISSIGTTGNGAKVDFTGTINASQSLIPANLVQQVALLQNQVSFTSVATSGAGIVMQDVPVIDANGNPTVNGNLYAPNALPTTPPTVVDATNTINYVTGVFTVTFPVAPAAGAQINSQTVPSVAAIPQGMLWFQNKFMLRPVPDQPYRIELEVYARPTELLSASATTQAPELAEWWQYIAYGASKKIFEDRMDMDSVQLIMPEFKEQEALCLRRTIVQLNNQRTATIYTDQTSLAGSLNGWGSWNF